MNKMCAVECSRSREVTLLQKIGNNVTLCICNPTLCFSPWNMGFISESAKTI